MGDDRHASADEFPDSVDIGGIRSVLESADVRYAVVFGSYATDSVSPNSDLDIGIRFAETLSRRERFQQRNRVDAALQSYADAFVDVSDIQALPDGVTLNALRDGIVVYGDSDAKDADERHLAESAAKSADQRARQRREFIDRLAEGDV